MTLVPTEYGYSVHCYGRCDENTCVFMAFDDEWYDGHSESSFTNWEEAVAEISEYAHRNNTTLEQLEGDES